MAWILAVDDEEGIRNLIQNALEKDGHRVSVCENTEVIKEKDLIHYDLILLDIMMPRDHQRICHIYRQVTCKNCRDQHCSTVYRCCMEPLKRGTYMVL